MDQAVKAICDIMRRGNCAGVMQYVPELTCVLLQHPLGEFRHRVDREVPRLVLRLAKAKAAETAAQAGVPGGGEIGEVIPHHPVVSIQRHAHLFGANRSGAGSGLSVGASPPPTTAPKYCAMSRPSRIRRVTGPGLLVTTPIRQPAARNASKVSTTPE